MTVIWDKIKKNVIDSLNLAIDKTEELTSVGRIKIEILQLEHRLDEKYAKMGKYVFQQLAGFRVKKRRAYSQVHADEHTEAEMDNGAYGHVQGGAADRQEA